MNKAREAVIDMRVTRRRGYRRLLAKLSGYQQIGNFWVEIHPGDSERLVVDEALREDYMRENKAADEAFARRLFAAAAWLAGGQ